LTSLGCSGGKGFRVFVQQDGPAAVRIASTTEQEYEPARQVTRKDALLRNEFSPALVIVGTKFPGIWIARDTLSITPIRTARHRLKFIRTHSRCRISRYYAAFDEEARLESGGFLLEALRTRELLDRHLPSPPVTVFNAGGGAGAYSLWLTEKGYEAHLLDPVASHTEKARTRNEPDS